jgi:pyruvate/2-oxoglutarate dehydrogenase complex dihydrolipoamide dehydrogenase (E3) component
LNNSVVQTACRRHGRGEFVEEHDLTVDEMEGAHTRTISFDQAIIAT